MKEYKDITFSDFRREQPHVVMGVEPATFTMPARIMGEGERVYTGRCILIHPDGHSEGKAVLLGNLTADGKTVAEVREKMPQWEIENFAILKNYDE